MVKGNVLINSAALCHESEASYYTTAPLAFLSLKLTKFNSSLQALAFLRPLQKSAELVTHTAITAYTIVLFFFIALNI